MRIIILTLAVCGYALAQQRRRPEHFPEFRPQPQQQESDYNQFQQQQPRQFHPPEPTASSQVLDRVRPTPIPIIRFDKQQAIDGSYKASYETGNSIIAEETGFLKNIGVKDEEALVQYGSYSYTDPDGHVISVRYTADEGGFRAEGDHLPTPPPVPPGVQKGLDIIFESIRQQAEKDAQEKRYENSQLESANYPASRQEDDGRYRPQ
uniref:Putative insect cuticle protein n=1 Tax=Triatoma infestans TaxID=30076 RepID=A0A023F7I5_TRIIF